MSTGTATGTDAVTEIGTRRRATLRVAVESIAVLGPGLTDWAQAAPIAHGRQPLVRVDTVVPASQRLAATERRRVGGPVKLAMAVAEQLFANARARPEDTATVFTSSSGDGDNCDALCSALAEDDPGLSPTRFTNSVHNTASGYWTIAVGAMAPATSLCAYDGSFCAGLLEAATQACADGVPVALLAFEHPYREPIRAKRNIEAAFGVGLLLWPVDPAAVADADPLLCGANDPLDSPITWLELDGYRSDLPATVCGSPELEHLRLAIPAARCLPLLERIASRETGEVLLAGNAGQVLPVRVHF